MPGNVILGREILDGYYGSVRSAPLATGSLPTAAIALGSRPNAGQFTWATTAQGQGLLQQTGLVVNGNPEAELALFSADGTPQDRELHETILDLINDVRVGGVIVASWPVGMGEIRTAPGAGSHQNTINANPNTRFIRNANGSQIARLAIRAGHDLESGIFEWRLGFSGCGDALPI